ncbi:MAG TPA: undecaprenyl-phosphate glucose phosphotransferase [Vicinamibacterales bacterium]|nr:undecaprenyl-phosphate glucose phosphotransferase [Vicinamibacterales bacterium]
MTNLQLTLLTGLWGLLPPTVSTLVLLVSTKLLDVRLTGAYVALGLVSALLCWIVMAKDHPDQRSIPSSLLSETGRVLIEWFMVVATLLLIGYATKTSANFSRRALFLWAAVTPTILVAASMFIHQWVRRVTASASNARRAVIVGTSSSSLQLVRLIAARPELGLRVACVFDPDHHCAAELSSLPQPVEIRSDCRGVRSYVNTHRIDVVFIALPVGTRRTEGILNSLRDTTASVYLIPDVSIVDLIQAHSEDIDGIPVIALCESPFRGVRGVLKRATDIVFASIILLLALPVMAVIAAAIKLTSRGAVIFKQHRYGLEGERITVYKFRTMTVMEDGPIVQAQRNDPRVTPIGRFLRRTSLDELPQLINVLQGRMSLVGPRPHAIAHNEQYRKLIAGYMVRHKVPPGMTGLAQVNGCRGETATLEEMERRVAYDLEYLRHWCWLLDLKIIVKTCLLLLRDERAY